MLHVVTAELQETEIRKNLVLQWDGHDRITKIITLIGPGGGASSSPACAACAFRNGNGDRKCGCNRARNPVKQWRTGGNSRSGLHCTPNRSCQHQIQQKRTLFSHTLRTCSDLDLRATQLTFNGTRLHWVLWRNFPNGSRDSSVLWRDGQARGSELRHQAVAQEPLPLALAPKPLRGIAEVAEGAVAAARAALQDEGARAALPIPMPLAALRI